MSKEKKPRTKKRGAKRVLLTILLVVLILCVVAGLGATAYVLSLARELPDITVEDLKSKKRKADIAFPRQVAIYLCRTLTDESFPKIGIQFGGRDHSTVMYACDKIRYDIETDEELKKEVQSIMDSIKI